MEATRGLLRVGLDEFPAPPLCFGPPGTPDCRGFEIDLLTAVSESLASELRCHGMTWAAGLAALESGDVDMLCRAVTISPARRKFVAFSDAYLETHLALAVRTGSPVRHPSDLIGVKVAVRRATVAEEFVRSTAPAAVVCPFEGHEEQYAALRGRIVDAVVDHRPIAAYCTREEDGIRIVRVLDEVEIRCGFVFAVHNDPLRLAVNSALAGLRDDGRWETARRRWLDDPVRT